MKRRNVLFGLLAVPLAAFASGKELSDANETGVSFRRDSFGKMDIAYGLTPIKPETAARVKIETLRVGQVEKTTITEESFMGTMDGEAWAKAFVEQVEAGQLDPRNVEDVRAWFQNAIMKGYDRGRPVNGDHVQFLRDRGLVVDMDKVSDTVRKVIREEMNLGSVRKF